MIFLFLLKIEQSRVPAEDLFQNIIKIRFPLCIWQIDRKY